jgi:hypothetical protein
LIEVSVSDELLVAFVLVFVFLRCFIGLELRKKLNPLVTTNCIVGAFVENWLDERS